jgi:hypothetical protein
LFSSLRSANIRQEAFRRLGETWASRLSNAPACRSAGGAKTRGVIAWDFRKSTKKAVWESGNFFHAKRKYIQSFSVLAYYLRTVLENGGAETRMFKIKSSRGSICIVPKKACTDFWSSLNFLQPSAPCCTCMVGCSVRINILANVSKISTTLQHTIQQALQILDALSVKTALYVQNQISGPAALYPYLPSASSSTHRMQKDYKGREPGRKRSTTPRTRCVRSVQFAEEPQTRV